MRSPVTIAGIWLARAAANAGVFLGAIVLAMLVATPLTNSFDLQVSIMCVALVGAGALTRLWAQQWSVVAAPAALVSLAVIVLLGAAIYLGDGGTPSIMWRYVPGVGGFIAAVVMTVCALAGWALLGRLQMNWVGQR